MELKELQVALRELGLHLMRFEDGDCSVVKKGIANPLLFFTDSKDEYRGSVTVKAINMYIFSQEQVYKSLCLVSEYLR